MRTTVTENRMRCLLVAILPTLSAELLRPQILQMLSAELATRGRKTSSATRFDSRILGVSGREVGREPFKDLLIRASTFLPLLLEIADVPTDQPVNGGHDRIH